MTTRKVKQSESTADFKARIAAMLRQPPKPNRWLTRSKRDRGYAPPPVRPAK